MSSNFTVIYADDDVKISDQTSFYRHCSCIV